MRCAGLATFALLLLSPVALPAQPADHPEAKAKRADEAAPAPTAKVRYGADDLRSGELRLPEGRGPFPVAVIVHGGCFIKQLGGTGMQSLAEMLRKRGIATWDIDYRRYGHPGGGWPGSFQDIAAGVDHLTVLAKRYPLDTKRVTVAGHSSGALFALWAASRPKLPAPWTATKASPRFRSAIAIDGPGSLAPMVGIDAMVCGKPVIVPFMGGTPAEKPAEYKLASPADHLPLGMPQLFVLGELGRFMQPYVQEAEAAGDPVKTIAPPSANHFDIITGGDKNGEAVADWIAANAFGTTGQR